jgi:DNA-binding NtrC family response regulator
MRVLCITSDDAEQEKNKTVLSDFELEFAKTGYEGLRILNGNALDAVFVRMPLEDWAAEEMVEQALRIDSAIPVVVHDANGSIADAVRLTRLGAFHYLGGATAPEELRCVLESAVEHRRGGQAILTGTEEPWRRLLVGASRAMQNVAHVIRLIGPRRSTVLITGETGTGKEMAARAIHVASPRGRLPLVAVNCSALPEYLLEAELFGHVRGAFTGAIQNRVGRFEQAHRSTLFLDEVGDMPLELQAKLLRVLQEREFQRIGSSETVKVDIRVIAASNADLVERIQQGKFREDLYYRLNVVPLWIPPLRDRVRDIPLLVHHFIEKVCRQEEIPTKQIAPETLGRLTRHPWPGNVRQLENAVEMAVALSGDRPILYPSDFPLSPELPAKPISAATAPLIAVPDDGLDFEQTVGSIERAILQQALRKTGGNKKQAADMLRLKRTTLSAKLKSMETAACGTAA